MSEYATCQRHLDFCKAETGKMQLENERASQAMITGADAPPAGGDAAQAVDCFDVPPAGHNRPVQEVLFPKTKPFEPAFSNESSGMSLEPVDLESLVQVQARLLQQLPQRLTAVHREFLRSLVQGNPAWEEMPMRHHFRRFQRLDDVRPGLKSCCDPESSDSGSARNRSDCRGIGCDPTREGTRNAFCRA